MAASRASGVPAKLIVGQAALESGWGRREIRNPDGSTSFNVFGIMENGFAYVAHLAGPVWWLAPLLFPIEVVSLCIRPITLAVRLMLNMAVDHILLGIIAGLVGLFVPIPIMMLGTLVCFVQVYVFCMLASIYIALATEDMHHGHGDDHAHAHGH